MGENSKNKRTIKSTEAWEKLMSNFTDDLWIELMIAAKDDQVLIVHGESHELEEVDDGSFSLFHLGSARICSDCGIVCVSVDLSDWPVTKKDFDMYLWNPATRHSKLIPPYTKPDDGSTSGAFGFGFDHIDLDFKLVKVLSRSLSAQVYSSNRNVWRNIQPKPIDFPQGNIFDVCFHGFLFAIGKNSGMMAFDLNKELFICDINLPGDAQSSLKTRVCDFKDTVAVMFSNMVNGKIQLWTLDDEACLCGGGVKALWTNVLSIDLGVPLNFVEGLFNNFQLLLVNRDGDRFMYDLTKKVTTNVTGPYFETGEIFKYTESLFLLEGFKRIKWAASSMRLQDSSDSDEEMDE
ncbi:F-box domain-containing protein [Heracleum sosnowskyi]|uniref:F-box domain-containing protein n=1 Tax=Heracleum sosnowskyi TaxID=360622 RepID=A0AAD8MPA5_9APIA|nr:F-box domain-containing protein [Heracleum sosnowskyi]